MAGNHVGALRRLANQNGLSLEEFRARTEAGLKWCYGCDAWHERAAFGKDPTRSGGVSPICRAKRNERQRGLYVRRARTKSRVQEWPT